SPAAGASTFTGSAMRSNSRAMAAPADSKLDSGRSIRTRLRTRAVRQIVEHTAHDFVLVHQQAAVALVEPLAFVHQLLERAPAALERRACSALQHAGHSADRRRRRTRR